MTITQIFTGKCPKCFIGTLAVDHEVQEMNCLSCGFVIYGNRPVIGRKPDCVGSGVTPAVDTVKYMRQNHATYGRCSICMKKERLVANASGTLVMMPHTPRVNKYIGPEDHKKEW